MDESQAWKWRVNTKQYYYWHEKEHFLLKEDMYSDWLIFAVERGSFRYKISDQTGIASKGDIVICPPNTMFHREIIERLTFHFFMFTLLDLNDRRIVEIAQIPQVNIKINDIKRLNSNFQHLKKAAEEGGTIYPYRINHLLYDIWYLCLSEKSFIEINSIGETDPIMDQALNIIKEHAFETSFNLKSLADQLCVRPVQLTRNFRFSFDLTPSQYLTKLRMQKAQHLLSTTDLKLDTIARQCGYENGYYFSRVFSKNNNTPPSLYRKMTQV